MTPIPRLSCSYSLPCLPSSSACTLVVSTIIIIIIIIIIIALILPLAALAKTPVATGTGGAVATISEPASKAALAILKQGGNAIDAAVAAAATLGVTDPFSCGIGGGGFMLIYLARDKRAITIDHRETAPASFMPTVFQQNDQEIRSTMSSWA